MTVSQSTSQTPYHKAVADIITEQERHQARFAEVRNAYGRYYDLVAKVGEDKASEALPEDAKTVKEFETAAPDRNRQMETVGKALQQTLEQKMHCLAADSVMSEGSVIGRLRADLIELENYRKTELDGIGGAFWRVVKQGDGANKEERGRMINRVLSAWCDVYEISPNTMVKAATIIDLVPDEFVANHNSYTEELTKHFTSYPFDIIADLKEVAGWGEKNNDAIRALSAFCEEAGSAQALGRT